MIFSLKYILSTLLCLQGIQAFCLINSMTDATSIEIEQDERLTANYRRFQAFLHAGKLKEKACCHYTNADCSPRKRNDSPVTFFIWYKFPKYESERFGVTCFTGGALEFKGDENHYWAECTDAWGAVTKSEVKPYAVQSKRRRRR